MSFGRIIIPDEVSVGHSFRLEGAEAVPLFLWQARIGSAVTVTNRQGMLFRARLTSIDKDSASLLIFEGLGKKGFFPEITLLQALPEKERMELIIQKSTELGVSKIIPFKSEKSISLEERESRQKKSHKWQEIALKAAKQSRRDSIPEVGSCVGFKEAHESLRDTDLKVILWENAKEPALKKLLIEKKAQAKRITVMSGPEGGFTEAEIKEARASGFIPVTFGKRVLRAETASIISVALIGYELEGNH